MIENTEKTTRSTRKPAVLVWLTYQRRAEVLAPMLNCPGVVYFPHYFKKQAFRFLDYGLELLQTISYLLHNRPSFVVLQAPPIFAAFAALVTRTPYVVDMHNGMVQSFWARVPLTGTFMRKAKVLMAHNSEIADLVKEQYPESKIITISDPIKMIGHGSQQREPNHILFICSFDRDEPLELIVEIIEALPEFTFTITANTQRLPSELQIRYRSCENLRLTGFLSTEDYQTLLCSSKAAVVLSTMPSVQPSGAVEALSSDTPLVVSRSTLTASLFGDWALVAENDLRSMVKAILSVSDAPLDLSADRNRWNQNVSRSVYELLEYMEKR